jgi:hypothetical protein
MTHEPRKLHEAILKEGLAALDGCAPDSLAAWEQWLANNPRAAEQLANMPARIESSLAGRQQIPAADEWDRVGSRLGLSRESQYSDRAGARVLRFPGQKWWIPATAVAACVLFTFSLLDGSRPKRRAAEPWGLQIAQDVVIDDLQVASSDSAFVMPLNDETGAVLIWAVGPNDG